MGVHAKIQVCMGRTCDGFQHSRRTGMDVYLANPDLWEDVDKFTFIMGRGAEAPKTLDHTPAHSHLFVVGDCAVE